MKIGTKGDYGLRALIDLAERFESGAIIQAKDISERQSIPKDYLALIMIDLRKAGLVDSVRGPGGGYRLAREPREITMGQALAALESPVSLIDCTTDLGFSDCTISLRCRMRNVWIEATRSVMAILDATSLADLCNPAGTPIELVHVTESPDPSMPEGLTFQI
ncbi:MAG TPA: Rrf2 family transcriptional regulator [Blastocatellia bacterium]|nr:Rrf2 family transcriptional regulator [Blastocatellia bacterium]